MLSQLFGGFIIIVIGVNLVPIVANGVTFAKTVNSTGGTSGTALLSGAASAMIDLVTLFYAMGIMVAAVATVISGLRQAGLV
jgi:hypothetical protein